MLCRLHNSVFTKYFTKCNFIKRKGEKKYNILDRYKPLLLNKTILIFLFVVSIVTDGAAISCFFFFFFNFSRNGESILNAF